MNIHYKTWIAQGRFTNMILTPSKQWGVCDNEIWRMTLKNNRTPLLSNIKVCASFHHHMWIQTWVTVRKRLSWVLSFLTSVTLTFDLWPWPFAWTSLLSMVITPENFMMVWWWEHSEKGVTDGRTDWTSHRAAWSQIKNIEDSRAGPVQCLHGHRTGSLWSPGIIRPYGAHGLMWPREQHWLKIHTGDSLCITGEKSYGC